MVLAIALIAIVPPAAPIAQTGSSSLAVVRYTHDGNLDATFGAGGRLIVPPGSAGFRGRASRLTGPTASCSPAPRADPRATSSLWSV
jgi:hypothetical protein